MINKKIIKVLENYSIFFINPDVKRGIGLDGILPDYHIICTYKDPLIPILRKQGANIYCLEEVESLPNIKKYNNTGSLLNNNIILNYIKENTKGKSHIMYFKPSLKIDQLIKKYEFHPIGNSAEINEEFENKIKSYNFSKKYLPEYTIKSVVGIFKKFQFNKLKNQFGLPFVVQFGHGWAGNTTFIIQNNDQFHGLSNKFENTLIKICRFVSGPTVINNCTIYKDQVIISDPASQISGVKKLYYNPMVTCGRQWPAISLSKKQIDAINTISLRVGSLMRKSGYIGFFGLDFIIDKNDNNIFLSEINARLTASSAFYTKLESETDVIPQMVYHIAAFLDVDIPKKEKYLNKINGSQIIIRQKENMDKLKRLPPYGVFGMNEGKTVLLKDNYNPQLLSANEFIYIKRLYLSEKSSANELARIETKDNVLKSIDTLEEKYNELLSGGN